MSAARVLMYHGFGSRDDRSDPHRLFVPTSSFEQQLDLLVASGARFLDLDGYLHGLAAGRWPARSVLLTIDDGYLSTLTEAAPVLAARGLPAVLFALPGRLGGRSDWMPEMPDDPLLAADGLRALEAQGVRVEVHGWDHTQLPGLPPAQLRRQVYEAREALGAVLGRPPVAFAYASGQHDAAARRAVQEAGFSCAFAVHEGAGPFAVKRVDVNPTDTTRTFGYKTSRWWPAAYELARHAAPVRRTVHRLVGSDR